MNRNVEKVKEDIRSGRTELVWEEDKDNPPGEYFDALIDDDPGGQPAVISIVNEKKRTFAVCTIYGIYLNNHPFRRYCKDKELPSVGYYNQIFKLGEITFDETKAKIQSLYNDYLLDQAQAKDEGRSL